MRGETSVAESKLGYYHANHWKSRVLNILWWLTAGILVLWGRALKWQLEPSLLEFSLSIVVWLVCSLAVTEVLCLAGRRIQILERSLALQTILGSLGHFLGSCALVGLLMLGMQFEPFTVDCPSFDDALHLLQTGCALDQTGVDCKDAMTCARYVAHQSDTALLLIVVLLLTAWIPTAASIAHLFRTQRLETDAVNARNALVEAKLNSVKNQVNSHFVFNALNSILTAIEDGSGGAGRMVMDLSRLLRESLETSTSVDSFAAEFERLQLYLRIEKYRFEDELTLSFRIQEGVFRYRCLPMTIQPLVENAVKHGMRTGKLPLHITIEAEVEDRMLKVTVINDGYLQTVHDKSHDSAVSSALIRQDAGVGVSLLRERLAIAYGMDWAFELTETTVNGISKVNACVSWPAEIVREEA
ncbi:MAG: sensor histidine kinase [Bradymonadia bacterium]